MNSNFSSKYPAEDRVKEMTKQEEILLKRKREIERRLQEGGGGGGRSVSKGPTAAPHHHHPKKRPLNISSSLPSNSVSSTTPIRSSAAGSGFMLNRFSNDGSFFEQFKRLAEKKIDIKEEKPSVIDKIKIAPKANKPTATNKVPLGKQKIHPAFSDDGPDMLYSPYSTEIKTELEMRDDGDDDVVYPRTAPAPEGGGGGGCNKEDINHPDWFKEALRRVQEKAKLLTSDSPPVSLSAGSSENGATTEEPQSKKRRSRWAETPLPEDVPAVAQRPASPPPPPIPPTVNLNVPANLMTMVGEGEHIEAIRGVMVTRITRNSPAIYAYAHKVFGSIDLSEAQWKQCEEQMKMNVVFQLLQAKQNEADRLERQGKVKYEYDSDEDVDGGTWEHKRRAKEMADTQIKAQELTVNAEGKHHIGDFLPPDELARFMEKYRALKEGRDPDLSDYQEHKLTEDNIGYKMLKSMGWTEGMGLGAEGKGITTPVNQTGRSENQGLGVDRPDSLSDNDDEYDAYRKRMMLAYRFRPNPLNNPRRAYY